MASKKASKGKGKGKGKGSASPPLPVARELPDWAQPVPTLSSNPPTHAELTAAMNEIATQMVAWSEEFEPDPRLEIQVNRHLDWRLSKIRLPHDENPDPMHLASSGYVLDVTQVTPGSRFRIALAASNLPLMGPAGLLFWQSGYWIEAPRDLDFVSDIEADAVGWTSHLYGFRPPASGFAVFEDLRAQIAEPIAHFLAGVSTMPPKAFVSYVRDDRDLVDRLCRDLAKLGVSTWTDRTELTPGVRWKTAIKDAIGGGSAFIGCFSSTSRNRSRSYMNEELTVAVEELRMRPREHTWFLPVSLDGTHIPDIPIGGGESLNDIQSIDLSRDWKRGVQALANAINANATS